MFGKKKVITIPLSGDVDVTDVLPLVEHEFVQRTRRVKQLGTVDYIFPGAVHTRFEHLLGAFQRQLIQNQRWRNEDVGLGEEELKALAVFALSHDIGHPALSHVTEYLLDINHDKFGAQLICELKSEIERCNVDFEIVKSMFSKENKLRAAVHDKNLGTEKLDYLERDAFHTNFGGRPEINRLFSYIYWNNEIESLMLDFKSIEEAKHLQRTYMLMYKRVYLRKSCLIVQRLIQKAVYELLKNGLKQELIYKMDDYDLIAKLRSSKNKIIQNILGFLNNRTLPKRFLSLHASGYEQKERVCDKDIEIFGTDKDKLTLLIDGLTPNKLAKLEKGVAKILSIPYSDVLIVPSQGGFRFVPKDIVLFDGDKLFSMREEYPEHFGAMRVESESFLCLRVCAVGDRATFVRKAGKVREFILG